MSVAVFVIAARLSAFRFGARLQSARLGRVAAQAGRLMYYVGLPYAALLAGAFAPRDVALQGSPAPDLILGWMPETWARALGTAVMLGAVTIAALATLAWQIRRAGSQPPAALNLDHRSLAASIREGAYAEIHWSFYRALPLVALATGAAVGTPSDSLRWAALAGLALITFEALLAGPTEAGAQRIRLSDALLATLSAVYYVMSGGNLWVAVVLQIVVRAALTGIAFAGRQADRPATAPDELIV